MFSKRVEICSNFGLNRVYPLRGFENGFKGFLVEGNQAASA